MVAVQLTLALAAPSTVGTCDLCATGPLALVDAVIVQHVGGSSVTFSACERWGRAMRRVAAAIGSDTETITTTVTSVIRARRPTARPRVLPAPPELIHEDVDQIADLDGMRYVVRVYGQPRTDGTWIGWLEFVALGAATVLRTGTETTQPDRAALAYWAGGLEGTYLEGAFARARRRRIRPVR